MVTNLWGASMADDDIFDDDEVAEDDEGDFADEEQNQARVSEDLVRLTRSSRHGVHGLLVLCLTVFLIGGKIWLDGF